MLASESRVDVQTTGDWITRSPSEFTDDSYMYGARLIQQWERPASDGLISITENANGPAYTVQWLCGLSDLRYRVGVEDRPSAVSAIEVVMEVVDEFHFGFLPDQESATRVFEKELASAGIAASLEKQLADTVSGFESWTRCTGESFTKNTTASRVRLAQWKSESETSLVIERVFETDEYSILIESETEEQEERAASSSEAAAVVESQMKELS